MKSLILSLSLDGRKVVLESSERSVQIVSSSEGKSGFYSGPVKRLFRRLLKRAGRPLCFEIRSSLKSDVFSEKSLKERIEDFSLLKKKDLSEARLFSLLKRQKVAVLLSERDFKEIEGRDESYLFGRVKEDSSGRVFVLPSSIEWALFFLLDPEVLISTTVGKKDEAWAVWVYTPRGVRIKRTHPLKEKLTRLAEEGRRRWPSMEIAPLPSFVIQIKITSDCNLNCSFCYYRRHRKEKIFRSPEEISQSVWKFSDCFRRAGFEKGAVLLHGGEPTVHPKLMKITHELSKKHAEILCRPPLLMTTNGLSLSQEVATSPLFARISVSFDPERFRDRPIYEKFVSQLKSCTSKAKTLAFLSVLGLDSPKALFSAYKKLFSDLKAEPFPIATERLVSDFPGELPYTHQKFMEDAIESLERARKDHLTLLVKVDSPSRGRRTVPGCGSCFVPSVVDVDGSVRACSKNYSAAPVALLDELHQAILALDQESARSFLTSLCFGKEKARREIICHLIGCERFQFCHQLSCISYPIVDQSLVCLQLEKEFELLPS